MHYIEIEPTYKSPKVVFDPKEQKLEISGRSVLVNVEEFYKPLLTWLDEFIVKKKNCNIEFTFDLEYFNLASSKRFLFFLFKLQEVKKNGASVKINWYYPNNDPDVLETGMDFSKLLNLPFNFIGYEKMKKHKLFNSETNS